MLGWLYRVIIGQFNNCKHEYKIIQKTDIYSSYEDKFPYSVRYDMKCTKCGDITFRKP